MSSLIIEVCKINKIETHPNADKLDIVTVKGWNCIVGRNQYKIGDLVIYCPPDSIIPQNLIDKYKLEFLRKNGRVGTIKLRGIISQGLILDCSYDNVYEGQDVAKDLGIIKYEEAPFNPKCGRMVSKKKLNPLFDKYTDIENINNYNNVLKEGEEVVITEKIHGTNARYGNLPRRKHNIFDRIRALLCGDYEFVYGSHNVQKTLIRNRGGFYKDDVYSYIADKYKIKSWLPKDYIIYGEIYGCSIQDLTYGCNINEINLVVFDIKYKEKYLSWVELLRFANKYLYENNIKLPPVLFIGKYSDNIKNNCSKGNSLLYTSQIKEGCVIKPLIEREEHIGRVILKSINLDYLIRQKGTEYK